MFKTETLIAFVLVAKHRSFTLAAEEQCQTPMAISKQVSQLEQRLGAALFERTTRKVNLTEFGQSFLVKAKNILEQHDALQDWLETKKGEYTGSLKVLSQDIQTYEETVFPWLAEFSQLYPDIELSFDVQENAIDIEHNPNDIYWGVADYLGLKHPGLKRRSLWKTKLGIFASPDYLEKFGVPQTPDDLKHHQMISHTHSQPNNALAVNKTPNSDQIEMEFEILNAPIKTVACHSALAIDGLGLINALYDNNDIKQAVKNKRLVPVLTEYWYQNAEIYLYYHNVKIEQPKVRAFIDFFLSKRELW
ncbi:LysR family transcriptional regulator [Psychrosphaera aestuarii]|uniref:LysR family transcriptional regulator n=1 Tax=Psychrosphaera aestuarii TaxID=1266052 RepID=UPI001B32D093|nr:LysR family transcriptional regulator [Psychrosphaera aestuarii]